MGPGDRNAVGGNGRWIEYQRPFGACRAGCELAQPQPETAALLCCGLLLLLRAQMGGGCIIPAGASAAGTAPGGLLCLEAAPCLQPSQSQCCGACRGR
jgi:hypothetical protein